MKFSPRTLLITLGLLGLASQAQGQLIYAVTSGGSGSFTASGTIFDGATSVGTWTSTISNAFTISNDATGQGTVDPAPASIFSTLAATQNSAPNLGITIRMNPGSLGGPPPAGMTRFTLAYSATITNGAYQLNNSYISGRSQPEFLFQGPTITNNASDRAVASTNTNSLTFSGFTGNATLADDASDGFDNLVQANGTTLVSGGTLNWALGSGASGARPAAETNWYVTIPTASAQTITYVADFGTGRNAADNLTIYTSAGNETTGFSFDIVLIPEPSAAVANRALLQAPCVSNHWRYRVLFCGLASA